MKKRKIVACYYVNQYKLLKMTIFSKNILIKRNPKIEVLIINGAHKLEEAKLINDYLISNGIKTISIFYNFKKNIFSKKIKLMERVKKLIENDNYKIIHPGILKIFIPFFTNSEFILFLDSDTFPNLDVDNFLSDNIGLMQKKSIFGRLGALPRQKWRIRLIDVIKTHDVNYENHCNGGVLFINNKMYKKELSSLRNTIKILIDDKKKIVNSGIDVPRLCDESFFLSHLKLISSNLKPEFNMSLWYDIDERFFYKDNYILHFVSCGKALLNLYLDNFDLAIQFYEKGKINRTWKWDVNKFREFHSIMKSIK